MSGIALIISGADFSASGKNIGTVTFQQDVAVTGITINMNVSYSGQSFQPTISYTPSTTNQKGVTWSITAGGTYATIDASTGLVTILSGASANSITIQAVSSVDNTIIATASTAVTYVATPIYPTALTISGSATISGQSSQYTVGYTPSNTNQQGVLWSIVSGGTYASIDANTGLLTILSGASASTVVIKATSTTDTNISATKSLTVTYELAQVGRKAIFAFPYDSNAASSISTVNPISGKKWNNLGLLLNHYAAATTFVDVDGNNWFSRLYQNSSDQPTALLSQLIATYMDTTTYPHIFYGLGDNPKNAYTYVTGLTANSNYDKQLFSGYNEMEETNTPKCHPYAILSVPTDATFTIRIFIAPPSAGSNNEYLIKFGANATVVNGLGAAPTNPLTTPLEITGVTSDASGHILLYALTSTYSYCRISMIEIERTA